MRSARAGWAAIISGAIIGWCAAARADATTQTDGRDYEVLAYLPNNTAIGVAYFRDQSSSDSESYSAALGVFRAVYILKFGDLAIVPLDGYIPVEDLTVYAGPGTLHASSITDITYNPTIGYIVHEDDADQTHTIFAFTPYITMPTGSYDTTRTLNIGNNRWSFQPQVAVGQRLVKALTLELALNMTFHTDNTDFTAPVVGKTSLKQKPTLALDSHAVLDLSKSFYVGVSYYVVANGRTYFEPTTPAGTVDVTAIDEQTVQSLRFTWGVHVAPESLLLLQLNQDVAASGGGTISRFFGIRFSHAFSPFTPAPAAAAGAGAHAAPEAAPEMPAARPATMVPTAPPAPPAATPGAPPPTP